MTNEQKKPVRSRDEQVADLVDCLIKDGSGFHKSTIEYTAIAFIEEAEARGAAAERERCAKVCDDRVSGTFPDIRNPTDADHRQIAWDAACEELAEAIRSTTK